MDHNPGLDATTAPPERLSVDELFHSTYDDLRRIARARLRSSGTLTLLDTTTLVHECYLRIARVREIGVELESQFLAYASSVMRSVIVDVVRRRQTQRRGGGDPHEPLDEALTAAPEHQILDTSAALVALAQAEPRLAKVVEMRYFGGFSDQEIACALGVTDRTVRRDLEKARDLLRVVLAPQPGGTAERGA